MKKLLILFLLVSLCALCAGCSDSSEKSSGGSPKSSSGLGNLFGSGNVLFPDPPVDSVEPAADPSYEMASWENYTSGDYEYYLMKDGTAEIARYNGSEEAVTIPVELDGHRVSGIGCYAFDSIDTIRSLTIPEGITTIREYAVSRCPHLTRIIVSDSVSAVGAEAFESLSDYLPDAAGELVMSSDHPYLAVVDNVLFSRADRRVIQCLRLLPARYSLPDGVRIIGKGAFAMQSSLVSITLPDSVITIDNFAFDDCQSLTSINIPDSMTTIGRAVFNLCSSLKSITIPASVTSIGNDLFWDDYEPAPKDRVTVTVFRGSCAEQYCMEKSIPYIYAD